MEKITVIRKEPGKQPELIEIENTLQALQEQVGGYIEVVTLRSGKAAIVCDEEGRLKEKPMNLLFHGMLLDFRGTVLIVGVDGEDFCSTPDVDPLLFALFGSVRYTRADRKHNVWSCRRCGHQQQLEADGPFENGWDFCPHCGGRILRPLSYDRPRE